MRRHGARSARATMLSLLTLLLVGASSFRSANLAPVIARSRFALTEDRTRVGPIAGTLVDPDGGAVVDVELHLWPADEATRARQPSPFENWPPAHTRACTDQAGAFSFDGVPVGNYTLTAGLAYAETWQAPELVAPGSTALRFVFDRARVRVRLLGGDGNALRLERGASAGWNAEQPLAVEPFFCVVDGSAADRVPVALELLGRTPDSALFAVDAGQSYVVGCFSPAYGLSEQRISLVPGAWTAEVTMRPRTVDANGTLAVRMFDPSGEERPFAFAMELLAPLSRVVLRRAGVLRDEVSAFLDPLPVGEYLLRVDDEPRCFTWCGRGCETRPARYGAFEGLVQLERDATTTVEARLWAGGRIELDLALDPDVREACFARWRSSCARAETEFETAWNSVQLFRAGCESREARELWSWRALGSRGPAAHVTLRALDGETSSELDFFAPGDALVGAERGVIPGTRATSATLLRAGRYVLRIEHAEFEPIERAVDVLADEVQRVRLALLRRR